MLYHYYSILEKRIDASFLLSYFSSPSIPVYGGFSITRKYSFNQTNYIMPPPKVKMVHHSNFSELNLTNRGIRRFKIKEIPFREDFPFHSTWKRYKHSGHFSRFRIITGSVSIVKQKYYVLHV
jgi:hypothetical protein